MNRMPRSDYRNIRTESHIITDFNLCDINDSTTVVRIEIITDFNMLAIIAAKRWFDVYAFSVLYSQQFKKQDSLGTLNGTERLNERRSSLDLNCSARTEASEI